MCENEKLVMLLSSIIVDKEKLILLETSLALKKFIKFHSSWKI